MTEDGVRVSIETLDDGVTAPWGFGAAGITAGLKASGRSDMALVVADGLCTAAAVLTTNQIKAAPVTLTAEHLVASGGVARAVLLNAGSANVCCGAPGVDLALAAATTAAEAIGCATEEVLLCSTGVIGKPIPAEPYLAGIPRLVSAASPEGGRAAAEAIMTTDLTSKEAAVHVTDSEGGSVTVGGMAKGSGMIAPSMATMLCVVTTDAALTPAQARSILTNAASTTFGRISVDASMSTNDTVILLASGTAATPVDPDAVEDGVTAVLADLSMQVVRDGEGAGRVAHITVTGATSDAEALTVARQVGNDSLVKTALAGADPNWGRIIAAAGAANATLDPDRVSIDLGTPDVGATPVTSVADTWPAAPADVDARTTVRVCQDGVGTGFDQTAAERIMGGTDVRITVDLGVGDGRATFLTCDLTHGYITINAEYTT